MDRRMAQKRGGGKKNTELDERWMGIDPAAPADAQYEAAVFRAKVEAAIRMTERESDFMDAQIYRMRVLESRPGKEVGEALGCSEPTVSRRLGKVRDTLRTRLSEVIATYSFTQDELGEAERNGLAANPKDKATPADDAMFDEAIAEIYHQQMELRRRDEKVLATGGY